MRTKKVDGLKKVLPEKKRKVFDINEKTLQKSNIKREEFDDDCKENAWISAAAIEGFKAERWRKDVAGNCLLKKAAGACESYGYHFDHSNGNRGDNRMDNCQIMHWLANIKKSNRRMTVKEMEEEFYVTEPSEVKKMKQFEDAYYCKLKCPDAENPGHLALEDITALRDDVDIGGADSDLAKKQCLSMRDGRGKEEKPYALRKRGQKNHQSS